MSFWRTIFDPQVDRSALSEDAQNQRDKVLSQKSRVTSRISETTRTISFGVLASCYALLLVDEKLAPEFEPVRWPLLLAAATALVAIICDALQYTFGYINAQQALARDDQKYPKNWSRHGRQLCFLLKQVFAYAAAILLLGAICAVLFGLVGANA